MTVAVNTVGGVLPQSTQLSVEIMLNMGCAVFADTHCIERIRESWTRVVKVSLEVGLEVMVCELEKLLYL